MDTNNQVQKQEQQTSVIAYRPNLKVALQTGNKNQVQVILRGFKTQTGAVNYSAVFSIPSTERIVKLAENDFAGTLTVITAGLTLAMESLNLKTPMNPLQIVDLADAIIDTAGEDNLSLEDLMLFLQNLTRGKYNPLYESMDVSKFMDKFEIYRQERHEAVLNYNENRHLELKALGNPERTGLQASALDVHLSEFSTKLQAYKDELHEAKQELKRKQ